jgi:amidase
MKQVVSSLRKAGHIIVDLPVDEIHDLHRRGTSCTMKSNVQSGGCSVLKHIEASGEPVVPRTATGSPASFLSTPEIFQNHVVRAGLSARYNDLWLQFKLDAILAPAVAHPAPPHGEYVSNSYAGIYNMLDYATGSVPVTTVDLQLDVAPKEWYDREPYPRLEKDAFPYDWGDKEMKEIYVGPQIYKDSPVGVQIACRRLREEKLVGILKEVEALLKQ